MRRVGRVAFAGYIGCTGGTRVAGTLESCIGGEPETFERLPVVILGAKIHLVGLRIGPLRCTPNRMRYISYPWWINYHEIARLNMQRYFLEMDITNRAYLENSLCIFLRCDYS